MKRFVFYSALLTLLTTHSLLVAQAQTIEPDSLRMQWFADAKLGIFIHWGIYSTGKTSESWAFHNKHITHSDYMEQIDEFTAVNYNPAIWADLIQKSGARYAVITCKHHDGVALWDTKMNNLSTEKSSPAKRDVLSPFVDELRKAGLKVGLYYSLIDWSYPDYPGFLKDSSRYTIADDPMRWQRFLKFCHGQIAELLGQYNPDLLWFDGDWEHSAEEWDASGIRKMILNNNPNTIINGRLQGYGDYDTPEQNFPVSRPNLDYWELCMTTNESWGYYLGDTNFKTPYEIISIFADCISMGGNLLLDIGPQSDGTIPREQVEILTELGYWTHKHSEAIFESRAGISQGHFYGPTTISQDSTTLYLFLQGHQCGNVILKGLNNTIRSVEVLGNGTLLKHKVVGKISWSKVPGLVYIDIPEGVQDKYMTVLKVTLEGPVSLYKGNGGL
ncbi:MAG: alpha-L-fucosidase [Bacteroidetes bacterium HGW-Bacteroidetes-6]|jgi:alpha-L-fucosidase|nr:MAG: alpha-L-fucosidase [Bacteroidetes bacterium HGW-Bacteroidetes-6]